MFCWVVAIIVNPKLLCFCSFRTCRAAAPMSCGAFSACSASCKFVFTGLSLPLLPPTAAPPSFSLCFPWVLLVHSFAYFQSSACIDSLRYYSWQRAAQRLAQDPYSYRKTAVYNELDLQQLHGDRQKNPKYKEINTIVFKLWKKNDTHNWAKNHKSPNTSLQKAATIVFIITFCT